MVKIDGTVLFEERVEIKAEGVGRAAIERGVAGLDGVLSIDLGTRARKIKQKGELRAISREQLKKRIEQIMAFLDGKSHKLETQEGDIYENVRMDSFKESGENKSGTGVVVEYEVEWTQLT